MLTSPKSMVNFQTFQSLQLFSSIPSRLPSVAAIEGYKGIKLRVAESAPLRMLHANKPVSNWVTLWLPGVGVTHKGFSCIYLFISLI